ncbi:hypothetical protein ATY29_19275 [Rhizobium hidalgonense]|nr:hypothetical protein ATY29_19275 [Rhizobium hidalgonense]
MKNLGLFPCIFATILAVALAQSAGFARAQDAGAGPPPIQSINFFEPVSFPEVQQFAVYKDSFGFLYVAPTALRIDQDSLSLVYDSRVHGAHSATLSLKVTPALSSTLADKEVISEVQKSYPGSKIQYLDPRLVRVDSTIIDQDYTITPFTTTLRLGQELYVNLPVKDDVISFLLTGRTTDVVVGSVRLTYTVRGAEVGLDGRPTVADRRILISGYVNGGCAKHSQRYVDVATGRTGCNIPIKYGLDEVVAVQSELHRIGYYKGPIDGIVGHLTRAAVRQAQVVLGRPANGLLDYWTVNGILRGEVASKAVESKGQI